MKQKILKISKFKKMAMNLINSVEDRSNILANDLTEDFYRELENMIKDGEIIIIQITGKMRLGKSTMGFKIAQDIFNLLKKYNKRSQNESFGVENIARDQHEKLIYMLNPNNKFNVIVTDEFNEMEDSGINSTANDKLLKDFSNIQAGRYIHGVNISPTGIIDHNTDLVLNVIEKRRSNMTCICELKYREYTMGNWIEVTLGRVEIYVGDIINTWESIVKKHYDKPIWNENDKRIIKQYVKKDWYTKYVIRKFQKMDLVNKEGIMRPRELQWIELQWDIINKFKDLTKHVKLTSGSTIKALINPFLEKRKIPVSILGSRELSDKVMGILKLYEDFHKETNAKNKLKLRLSKGNLNQEEINEINNIIKGKTEFLKEISKVIIESEEDFKRKIELKKKYDKVDEEW